MRSTLAMLCPLLLLACGGPAPEKTGETIDPDPGDTTSPQTIPCDCCDAFDPNDDLASAVEMVSGEPLQVSVDYRDYWTITVASSEQVSVTSTDPAMEYDLLADDGSPMLERSSRSLLGLTNTSDADITYAFQAVPGEPSCTPYTLTAEVEPGAYCPEDAIGDTWTDAETLQLEPQPDGRPDGALVEEVIHSGDEDWYAFEVEAGLIAEVRIYAGISVSAEVYLDPAEAPLASASNYFYTYEYLQPESIGPLAETSTLYLRVYDDGGRSQCDPITITVSEYAFGI